MTAAGPAEPTQEQRGRGRPRTGGARDVLTVREVAESQGVTAGAIRWHIRQGHIPHIRRGVRVLIPRKAYEAQLAGAGPETLTGLLGLHREELEAIVRKAVAEELRAMFGLLAQPPKEEEWAPWREPGRGRRQRP